MPDKAPDYFDHKCLMCGGETEDVYKLQGIKVPVCMSCRYEWADRNSLVAHSVMRNVLEKYLCLITSES